MGLGLLGVIGAVSVFVTLLIGGPALDDMEAPFTVAFLTLWFTLMVVLAIEFARGVFLLLRFIARKTGLLGHNT